MKNVILFLLLIGTDRLTFAGDTNPAATFSAATIVFDSETYNFGRAKSGETIKHDFIFTNTGNTSLEITDVKLGCGCTTAGAWDKTVAPGRTGTIPLQFNSTGFGGQVAKSATVSCNDRAHTNIVLQLTGTVWKPIDVMPALTMFNVSAESPTNETKVVRIASNLEEPVALSDLHCSSTCFKAELKEIKPGKEFELRVTVLPPLETPTTFSTITLKSSSTNAPILSVSAYAIMQHPLLVSPQQVTVPAGPLKAPAHAAVLVRNLTTNPVAISDVRLDLAGVDVKVSEVQTGRLYSIGMTFPTGFQLQAGQRPELTMKSTHPKFPELRVPLLQNNLLAAAGANSAAVDSSPLRTASPISPAPRAAISGVGTGSPRASQ